MFFKCERKMWKVDTKNPSADHPGSGAHCRQTVSESRNQRAVVRIFLVAEDGFSVSPARWLQRHDLPEETHSSARPAGCIKPPSRLGDVLFDSREGRDAGSSQADRLSSSDA
jgi:hypothetical protein